MKTDSVIGATVLFGVCLPMGIIFYTGFDHRQKLDDWAKRCQQANGYVMYETNNKVVCVSEYKTINLGKDAK